MQRTSYSFGTHVMRMDCASGMASSGANLAFFMLMVLSCSVGTVAARYKSVPPDNLGGRLVLALRKRDGRLHQHHIHSKADRVR